MTIKDLKEYIKTNNLSDDTEIFVGDADGETSEIQFDSGSLNYGGNSYLLVYTNL